MNGCFQQVQLELTRSFVENQDGSFDPYIPKSVDPSITSGKTDPCLPTLKPLELRTFLQIGQTEGTDPASSIPFIIEWTPDVLPQAKFGELSLQFRFGHQRHPALPLPSVERQCNGKRAVSGIQLSATTMQPRRKKTKVVSTVVPVPLEASIAANEMDAKEGEPLQNLRLDFDGVAPLNDSEFQELTKSVP